MLISAKNEGADLIFFSPKEAQILLNQLQKLSARMIAALKCQKKPKKQMSGTMVPLLCS